MSGLSAIPAPASDSIARRRGRPPATPDAATVDLSAERSQRIVVAAHELLDESGLEALTIRAVLQRTGLSRRAFYERFAGKDDLVLAVFEHSLRWAAARFEQWTETMPDPIERLRLIVESIASASGEAMGPFDPRSSRRSAALAREHLRLAEARPKDLQVALAPLIGLIARQLADGMETGQVRRTSPERLATLVYNLVSTTVHSELIAHEADGDGGPDEAAPQEMAQDIWDFCRRAISA